MLHIVPRWSLRVQNPRGGFISWEALVGEAALSMNQANAALDENDAFAGTDEARYQHMVEWNRRRVAEEERADG
jgi:hypothetical protein